MRADFVRRLDTPSFRFVGLTPIIISGLSRAHLHTCIVPAYNTRSRSCIKRPSVDPTPRPLLALINSRASCPEALGIFAQPSGLQAPTNLRNHVLRPARTQPGIYHLAKRSVLCQDRPRCNALGDAITPGFSLRCCCCCYVGESLLKSWLSSP